MNNYLVSYDLHQAGQDYSALIAKIKTAPCYIQVNRSVWYVKTPLPIEQVLQQLEQSIDFNDIVLVAELHNLAWSKSLPLDIQQFIQANWNF